MNNLYDPHERGFKLRIFPTITQQKILASYFGARRFVYNWGLAKINTHYEETKKSLSYSALSRELTNLKKEKVWLNGIPSSILGQALIDLDQAMQYFFARMKSSTWVAKAAKLKPRKDGKPHYYPRFRKKGFNDHINLRLDTREICNYGKPYFSFGEYICLPDARKGESFGYLKTRWTYQNVQLLPDHEHKSVPSKLTIRKLPSGKYQLSFMLRVPTQPPAKTKQACGVDLGIKNLFVNSDGISQPSLEPFRESQKKLARAQRKLSRCTKGSKRREKAKQRVALIHEQTANKRLDILHKTTSALVKQYDIIVIEDLNVAGMKKNRKLSKSLSDAAFGEFRRQLSYKVKWNDKHVEVINTFFPSSKMCCKCGTIHDMPLKKRAMDCDCGNKMNRDLNAAINIREEGFRLIRSSNNLTSKQLLKNLVH